MAKSNKTRRASPKRTASPRKRAASPRKRAPSKNAVEETLEWFSNMYPRMVITEQVYRYLKKVNIDAKYLLDVAQGIVFHRDGRNVIELDDLMEAKKQDTYLDNAFPTRRMTRSIPKPPPRDVADLSLDWFSNMYPRMVITEEVYDYLKKVNIDSKYLLDVAQGIVFHRDGRNLIELDDLMEAKKTDTYLNKAFPNHKR